MGPSLRTGCHLIAFQTIGDDRGWIAVTEVGREIPFPVKRVYQLYGVPPGGVRGGHAHRRLQQVIIAAAGSFDVVVDDGTQEQRFRLGRPDEGLFLPKLTWRQMERFSEGSVAVVLASEPYDADEYIRDYAQFLELSSSRR